MTEAAALSAVGKIGGWLIEPIQRELGYLFCFNNNIEDLQTRIDQLKATRNDVQAREDEAQRSWKTLGEAAKQWMVDTNGKIEEAENVIVHKAELENGCFSIKWCPNLKLRFSLGRKAKRLSFVLHDLLQSGRPYLPKTGLPIPLPPINMLHDNEDDTDLDSREKSMEEIIKLLKDKETRLIGICGMGGIGKTTFATQVLQMVQDLHLFDFQFMLTVSHNPNFSTLQQQALKRLGFKPSSTEIVDENETAQRLQSAFDKRKVVIVLDDVWEDFDLNDKGFPFLKSDVECCCKIIYTSRLQGLRLGQKTTKKEEIFLDLLSKRESLDLFIREANLNNKDDDFQEKNIIARKIVDECKGLPLALKVVGSALIEKRIYEWNNMLFSFQYHDQYVDKITMVLEKSYDFLKDHNLKLLFLLCCLFREGQEIPIEKLYLYAAGLQLFQDIYDLENVRNCVYTLVDKLIRRSLLINVEAMDHPDRKGERAVKMHDVLRDVGITIAKRHENGFSFLAYNSVNDLNNDFGQHTKMISILFQNMDPKVSPQLLEEFPSVREFRGSKLQLQLLQLDMGKYFGIDMSEDFFQRMNHLKVLVIDANFKHYYMPSKLSSFSYLANLKMLSLENLNISNLSNIRHLSFLEILSFRFSFIGVLPNEISELTHLKFLDLTKCSCFIRNGVLSKLTNLQELYMWDSFKDWRVPKIKSLPSTTTEDHMNSVAAELIELNHLNKLQRLELLVFNIKQLPRTVRLLHSSKLLKFKIGIQGEGRGSPMDVPRGERVICLTIEDDNIFHAFEVIMENNLTDIVLQNCESIITLSSLVKSSPQTSNIELGRYLRGIEIRKCNQMKYLNNFNEVKGLKKMEFNALETLKLYDLCRLRYFYKGIYETYFPKLKTLELVRLEQFILPTNVQLEIPCLEKLIIDSIPNLENLCNFVAPSLKELKIRNCPNFKYVFSSASSSMKENIFHLSSLYVRRCSSLKGILDASIDSRENWNTLFEFSNLYSLKLISLCELTSFVIKEEEKRQTSMFYHDEVSFPHLTYLDITELPKINYIVGWNGLQQQGRRYHHSDNKRMKLQPHILFPVLELASLNDLSNLTHIYETNHPELEQGVLLFQKLSQLTISKCTKLKYLFSENIGRVAAKHLEFLDISFCPIMEVVIKKDDKSTGGGESNYAPNNPFFPLLRRLTLSYLLELKRFYDVAYTWDLPSHICIDVSSCPKLEAPSLEFSKTEDDNHYYKSIEITAGDISNTMRDLFGMMDDSEEQEFLRWMMPLMTRNGDEDDGGILG